MMVQDRDLLQECVCMPLDAVEDVVPRRARSGVGLLLALSVTLVVPGSVLGQGVLAEAARGVARSWEDADATALGRIMREGGIGLHLDGEAHSMLGVRQAQAALRSFMAEMGSGTVRLTRVEELGGEPRKGFAELAWASGTGDPAGGSYSVFVGFSVVGGSWRIDEIRVFSSLPRSFHRPSRSPAAPWP